jgi:hypothetical protein
MGKETAPDQSASPGTTDSQPLVGGKPVATTKIKPCPDGYELVARVNGQRACAKDVIPTKE